MSQLGPSDSIALGIEAAGLCCAVGYKLDAACCALRAGVDHFQSSDFVARQGDLVRVARLPDDDIWGAERMARWIERAVNDCLDNARRPDPARTALIVLAPELHRPNMSVDEFQALLDTALRGVGLPFHDHSGLLPLGRAGLAQALTLASQVLADKALDHVLLVGADSLLDAGTINRCLDDERLLVRGNSDGFLPGEAAAAVLLVRASLVKPLPEPRLILAGWAQSNEAARWNNDIPNRAVALTQALRAACGMAGVAPQHLQFRMSDQNGEAYPAKEASNAISRLMFEAHLLPVLSLADKLGEVGAAHGVAALAFLSQVMPRPDCSPGTQGIVHLANDDGLRCAVVVRVNPHWATEES